MDAILIMAGSYWKLRREGKGARPQSWMTARLGSIWK